MYIYIYIYIYKFFRKSLSTILSRLKILDKI